LLAADAPPGDHRMPRARASIRSSAPHSVALGSLMAHHCVSDASLVSTLLRSTFGGHSEATTFKHDPLGSSERIFGEK
jgi:hypothetical protein